jgi:hypothetical protein
MVQWTDREIFKALDQIIKASAMDPDFRQLALRDPRAALSLVSDIPLPEGFTVRFVEPGTTDFVVVLPPIASPDGELTDSQLEQVAGGRGWQPVIDYSQPRGGN